MHLSQCERRRTWEEKRATMRMCMPHRRPGKGCDPYFAAWSTKACNWVFTVEKLRLFFNR